MLILGLAFLPAAAPMDAFRAYQSDSPDFVQGDGLFVALSDVTSHLAAQTIHPLALSDVGHGTTSHAEAVHAKSA